MKRISLSLLASTFLLSNSFANETPKRTLAGNMNITYKVLPKDVNSISNMFEEGMVYGRLRTNYFYFDWSEEDVEASKKDHQAIGVGGSLIFKTGRYNGLSGTVGLYTSQNPFFREKAEDVGIIKSGKDVFSRQKVKTGNGYGMSVVGESYLQYDVSKTSLKAGRHMFHSVFTKSNDTKMIPNTFDGLSIESRDIDGSVLQFAFFNAQKLRDHTSSHDVLTYNNEDGESWNNEDDSAAHKGLSYENFKANGKDVSHNLIIATADRKWFEKSLYTGISYLTVPDVISNVTFETHYKISTGDWSIVPGVRYMVQIDDGGGEIGGAALSGNTEGYSDPDSLDSSLLASRVVIQNKSKTAKILYGYSQVEDEADIVAPWRGFPTGGYTRAMKQYNWNANTKTHMVQMTYDFNKANIYSGFKTTLRYAMMDFDEDKKVQSDTNALHIDFWKTFDSIPNFETKVRMLFADVDDKNKVDNSYNEYRLEFNYLF
jgi:hypothetical protein